MTPSEVAQAAVRFERSGFDHIWLSESVGLDAFAVLGAVVAQTDRIGVGTGVVNIYSRAPTQTAMAAASIEQMAPGRFTLGVGAGSRGVVSAWHGLGFSDQLRRTEAYIDTLKLKLRRERGKLPEPFASVRRDIPIMVAGVQERMVALASRDSDGVIFFMRRLSDIRTKARELASDSFKVCANVVTCVSSDGRAAEARARKTVAYYLTYGDSYRRLIELQVGDGEMGDAVQAVRAAWLRGDVEGAARGVPEELLAEVAICGSPSQCSKKLEQYSSIKGLSMLGLQFNREGSLDDTIRHLSSLAGTSGRDTPPS